MKNISSSVVNMELYRRVWIMLQIYGDIWLCKLYRNAWKWNKIGENVVIVYEIGIYVYMMVRYISARLLELRLSLFLSLPLSLFSHALSLSL